MLYGFIGTDSQRARREMRELVMKLNSAGGSVQVVRFDDQNFDLGQAREALVDQNLFGGPNVVVFDDILAHPLGEEFYLKDLAGSENIIISRETSPKKAVLGKLSEFGEIKQFTLEKKVEENRFGSFALADAVFARDKKKAWVEFEKSRRRGEAMEAVHGMMFWALKSMVAVATLSRAEAIASGVKSFTYSKVHTGLMKYQTEEVLMHIDRLKDIYHMAHRGECDMEYSLEEFILKL